MTEEMNDLDVPSGLTPDGETLFREYHDELPDGQVPTVSERLVLIEAARHLAVAARLEEELSRMDTLLVDGSRGNTRVTPVVGELDKVRRTISTLLKSIAPSPVTESNRRTIASRYSTGPARLGG